MHRVTLMRVHGIDGLMIVTFVSIPVVKNNGRESYRTFYDKRNSERGD